MRLKLCTMATTCDYDWTYASFGPPESTNPNGKSIGSVVSAQLTAESSYTLMGNPDPHNCPFSWGSGPPSDSWFLGPVWALNPNGILISSAVLAQVTAECPLYQGTPLPPSKLPLPMGGFGPQSNTWFSGPTRVLNPNCISIGSPIFLQGSPVWQTDIPHYSVSNSRPHQHT